MDVDLLEQVEVHPVEALGDDDGVVERRTREPAPVVGLERLTHRARQLRPRPAEQRRPHARQLGPRQRLRIRRVEAPGQLGPEHVERALVAPPRRGALCVRSVCARSEERLGTAIPHEAREALVEGRLTLQVQRVVRQLVDHRRDELHRVALHDGGEQRVAEVAQRRKGTGRPEIGVVPLPLKVSGGATRLVEVEEPLVRHGAHDGVVPGVRAQPIRPAGREHEQQGVAPHLHVRRVGVARQELERIRGVGAGCEHEREPLAQRGWNLGVAHQPGDRAPRQEDAHLLDSGPREIASVIAQQQRQREQRWNTDQHPAQQPAGHAAPAWRGALGQGVHRNPNRCVPLRPTAVW